MAYERIGEWNKAEIDLKASLDFHRQMEIGQFLCT